MVVGVPTITTKYFGQDEFIDAYTISYEIVPVSESAHQEVDSLCGGKWAEPSVDDLHRSIDAQNCQKSKRSKEESTSRTEVCTGTVWNELTPPYGFSLLTLTWCIIAPAHQTVHSACRLRKQER